MVYVCRALICARACSFTCLHELTQFEASDAVTWLNRLIRSVQHFVPYETLPRDSVLTGLERFYDVVGVSRLLFYQCCERSRRSFASRVVDIEHEYQCPFTVTPPQTHLPPPCHIYRFMTSC